jgi:hypothetical protein
LVGVDRLEHRDPLVAEVDQVVDRLPARYVVIDVDGGVGRRLATGGHDLHAEGLEAEALVLLDLEADAV